MALDALVTEMVKETMQGLEQHLRAGNVIEKPVRISPRRMRSLILYSQQSMNVQIDGVVVRLVEDSDAPQDFVQAMTEAAPDPEPELPAPVAGVVADVDEMTEFRRWKSARDAALAAMGGEATGKGNAR